MVVVVGAGVIGLSTAVLLQEQSIPTRIVARDFSPHTTSDVAGAIWYPHRVADDPRLKGWAEETYQYLVEISGDPNSGVELREGKRIFHRPMGNPWWASFVRNFRRMSDDELVGTQKAGYVFQSPVIRMQHYLGTYLLNRFRVAGGVCEQATVSSLSEVARRYQAKCVINCTGLGAKQLCEDPDVYPVRGQVLFLSGVSESQFYIDSDNPDGMIYFLPRSDGVVVGGTSEKGEESLQPDDAQSCAVLERVTRHINNLGDCRVEKVSVGLRPYRRPIPRVELEDDGSAVVHNYGHGGAGVTLSWGCAREVLRLVANAKVPVSLTNCSAF